MDNYYFTNLRIYNGTNHSLDMYKPEDVYKPRNDDKYYLKTTSAKPIFKIEQDTALSVQYYNSNNSNIINSLYYYQPDSVCSHLDTLYDFIEYDTIVVSGKYAKIASQTFQQYNPEFLDRLFTPISIYSKENKTVEGAIGFKKVCYNKNLNDYWQMINRGERPSLSAIATLLNYYSSFNLDSNTMYYIDYLKQYLQRNQYNI